MTRATAFGNRTISGQRRDLDGVSRAASEEDDSTDSLEMAAMAKVWAHPEDLHKYPVSPSPSRLPQDCLLATAGLLSQHIFHSIPVLHM